MTKKGNVAQVEFYNIDKRAADKMGSRIKNNCTLNLYNILTRYRFKLQLIRSRTVPGFAQGSLEL